MTITINGTTGIAGVDGSAATPALQGSDTNTGVYFGTDLVYIATGGTAAVTVDSGQRTTFPTTIAVGAATPSTSGSGVSFPATQSASTDANTLDDYEEGTFSPTITGTTAAGTGTYAAQAGAYTKVGNTVFFSGYIEWSAHTGTGNMNLTNLPFTSKNDNSAMSPIRIYVQTAITLTAGKILQGSVAKNSTQVNLGQTATGGSDDAAVPLDTSAAFMFSGHYIVA